MVEVEAAFGRGRSAALLVAGTLCDLPDYVSDCIVERFCDLAGIKHVDSGKRQLQYVASEVP